MTIEEYALFCLDFKKAFPECEPPSWRVSAPIPRNQMTKAIARVKVHLLGRYNDDKAGLVMRFACPGTRKRRS